MCDFSFSIISDPEDVEVLRGRKSFNYAYDEAEISLLKKNMILEDSLYLLVENEGVFVGFCSTDRDWWEDGYFFIREIFVESSYVKKGVGEEMMKRSIKHAKNNQAVGVVTETDFKNGPMRKLCEKLGFCEWGNPEWKDGVTYKLVF